MAKGTHIYKHVMDFHSSGFVRAAVPAHQGEGTALVLLGGLPDVGCIYILSGLDPLVVSV